MDSAMSSMDNKTKWKVEKWCMLEWLFLNVAEDPTIPELYLMLWRKAQTKCMILRSENVSWIWPAKIKILIWGQWPWLWILPPIFWREKKWEVCRRLWMILQNIWDWRGFSWCLMPSRWWIIWINAVALKKNVVVEFGQWLQKKWWFYALACLLR